MRILVAGILGAFIGMERKNRNKMAGMRTHAIVALGAALIMVVSKYGFSDVGDYDASRVAAQIVSGVGFLGAGIIYVRDSNSVSGLTTAAGIWATAGVGMSVGAGQYVISICSTFLIIFIHVILHKFHFLSKESNHVFFKLTLSADAALPAIQTYLLKETIDIKAIIINKTKTSQIEVEYEALLPAEYDKANLFINLSKIQHVLLVNGEC